MYNFKSVIVPFRGFFAYIHLWSGWGQHFPKTTYSSSRPFHYHIKSIAAVTLPSDIWSFLQASLCLVFVYLNSYIRVVSHGADPLGRSRLAPLIHTEQAGDRSVFTQCAEMNLSEPRCSIWGDRIQITYDPLDGWSNASPAVYFEQIGSQAVVSGHISANISLPIEVNGWPAWIQLKYGKANPRGPIVWKGPYACRVVYLFVICFLIL